MRTLVAIAMAAASVAGAWQQPRRDARLERLVNDASGAPPEFEADALLRIASSSAVDARWRRELIENAFLRAYGAQEPYRRIGLGVPPDSRQGAMLAASDTRMTQVSLQVRAVQMMAFVDGRHARELFQWISPGVAATSCDDVLVPQLTEYYTTLSALARTTFADADRGDAMRFLEYYLWRAHLPSEMPSVALAIQRFHASSGEAAYLEALLRFIMEGGIRDPRGFSVGAVDLITRVGDLEDAHVEIGVMGRSPSHWLRDYLARYLKGIRCADSATEPVAAAAFNARIIRTEVVKDGVALLEGADLTPSRYANGAHIDFYWQTPEARRLQDAFIRLRGTGRNPVPDRIRRTQQWREQSEQFLTDLDRWSGAREATERDFFYQKAALFNEVLGLVPPGTVRTRGLRAFIDFLRHADMERNRRALWFVFANRLVELAHGDDREFILDAMEASGHPVLSLFARLERLLPQQTRTSPGTSQGQLAIAEKAGHS